MATPKLNDIQLILLATAAQRDDGSLLPPPESLGDQGARIRKAIPPLLKRALVEEIGVTDDARVWRQDGDARIGLVITAAGRAIIAVEEPDDARTGAPAAPAMADDTPGKPASKIATVLEMLRRDGGATLTDMVEATGWLPHTTRAALTGLRKRGHAITRTGETGASRYTVTAA
jgi:hypothetical protein